MPTPLSTVFSSVDSMKRRLIDALRNPVESAQQMVGHANDRARGLNELTSGAAQEMKQGLLSGGSTHGPKSQQLTQTIADAYNPMGMVVWHGSPHKFNKFDASKIGTGEGAQAYGHGLYLAESPDVATMYRDKLTDPSFKYAAQNEAKARLNEKIAKRVEATDPQRAAALRAQVETLKDPAGALYKVDLPDDAIAKMLDWDKPLSQQAPEVGVALNRLGVSTQPPQRVDVPNEVVGSVFDLMINPPERIGSHAIDLLNDAHGGPANVSRLMRNAGIPGIRYLDGGSRGTGAGTSNFVVFPGNEHLLQILERNGQPLGMMGIK